MRDHPPSSQVCRDGDYKPDSVILGDLDIPMCHHGKPGCRSPQADRVQNQGSLHASARGTRKDLVLSRAGRGNGSGGGHGGIPCIGCPLDEMGNQDGGLDHRVAVQG